MKFNKEYLEEAAPEAMKADGFDDCIVGIGYRCGSTPVLVYDIDMVVEEPAGTVCSTGATNPGNPCGAGR